MLIVPGFLGPFLDWLTINNILYNIYQKCCKVVEIVSDADIMPKAVHCKMLNSSSFNYVTFKRCTSYIVPTRPLSCGPRRSNANASDDLQMNLKLKMKVQIPNFVITVEPIELLI